MLARAVAISLAILLPTLSPAQSPTNPRVSAALDGLTYGIYCAQDPVRHDEAPDTASGTINIVPSIPEFPFRQKIVPAEVGIGFGVVASAPLGASLGPVTVTVTHPPYPDSGIEVEQWVTEVDSGENLMGFSFDHARELVLGEWTFSATALNGEELYFISFEVVEPALMPQVINSCFGSYLS